MSASRRAKLREPEDESDLAVAPLALRVSSAADVEFESIVGVSGPIGLAMTSRLLILTSGTPGARKSIVQRAGTFARDHDGRRDMFPMVDRRRWMLLRWLSAWLIAPLLLAGCGGGAKPAPDTQHQPSEAASAVKPAAPKPVRLTRGGERRPVDPLAGVGAGANRRPRPLRLLPDAARDRALHQAGDPGDLSRRDADDAEAADGVSGVQHATGAGLGDQADRLADLRYGVQSLPRRRPVRNRSDRAVR